MAGSPYDRAFGAGSFRFHFDDNTCLDYLNRFAIAAQFVSDKFNHSAVNDPEIYNFGRDGLVLEFNHRDVSAAMMTKQLGVTFQAAAVAATSIPMDETRVIPAAPAYTIVLTQTPISLTDIVVDGLIGGIPDFYGYEATPNAGCFKAAVATLTFNAAQAGQTVNIHYHYSSAAVGVAATSIPDSFIPPTMSGYGHIALGPQNGTRAKYMVIKCTNWVRGDGEFRLEVDKFKVHAGMDLQYLKGSSSLLETYLI